MDQTQPTETDAQLAEVCAQCLAYWGKAERQEGWIAWLVRQMAKWCPIGVTAAKDSQQKA